MPSYSVATTKDKLSSLIDKALAGEEVIVTRHGKPVAELRMIATDKETHPDKADLYEQLRRNLTDMPIMATSYMDLKRLDEAAGAL